MKKTSLSLIGLFALAFLLFIGADSKTIKDFETLFNTIPVVEEQKSSTGELTSSNSFQYKVLSVVDGDTIKLEIDRKSETVRLIGINTPETVDPRRPVECFGKEASDKAKEVLTGQSVTLEKDPSQNERDKYGRLLGYILLSTGQNFNKLMIEQGYAYEYTYEHPHVYQTEFKQAQTDAQNNKRGLWATNVCPVK